MRRVPLHGERVAKDHAKYATPSGVVCLAGCVFHPYIAPLAGYGRIAKGPELVSPP